MWADQLGLTSTQNRVDFDKYPMFMQGYRVWIFEHLEQEHSTNETTSLASLSGVERRRKARGRRVRFKCDSPACSWTTFDCGDLQMTGRMIEKRTIHKTDMMRQFALMAPLLIFMPFSAGYASDLDIDLLCQRGDTPSYLAHISLDQGTMAINTVSIRAATDRELDFEYIKFDQAEREYQYEETDRYIYGLGGGSVMEFFNMPSNISKNSLARALSLTITRLIESEDRSRNPIIAALAHAALVDRSQLVYYQLSSVASFGRPQRDFVDESRCEIVSLSHAETSMDNHIRALKELERRSYSEQLEKHAPEF